MDAARVRKLYDSVLQSLDTHRLYDALTSMGQLLAEAGQKQFSEPYHELCRDYQLLMNYMKEGYQDPDRRKLFRQFLQRSYDLGATIYREVHLRSAASYYASLWRTLQLMEGPKSLNELFRQPVFSYRQLFELAYTSDNWDEATYEAVKRGFAEQRFSAYEGPTLISAVTLAAMEFFDVKKIKLLVDLLNMTTSVACQARAMVGLVLLVLRHAERITVYPELETSLQALADTPIFLHSIRDLQVQLLLSLETQNIEKSLREEIIPDMMKQAQELKLNKKWGTDFFHENLHEMEMNPAWDQKLDKTGWSKKVHRLIEMQQKGADIFMGSFRMFKQKFPFFAVAANWFYPFDAEQDDVAAVLRNNPALKSFIQQAELCDSDKYSFCLMVGALPASQSDLLRQQLQAAGITDGSPMDQAAEHEVAKDKLIKHIRIYIQDMYRYFKLFPHHSPANDPFSGDLLLTDCPLLKTFFSEKDLQELGDFAFSENLYDLSKYFYEMLPPSADNFQKIGFSYQTKGAYEKAIQAYDKANLLGADNAWGYRHLADCYRRTGQYAKALQLYTKLEKANPEDSSNLVRIGECLICEGKFEEALPKLFKADYIDESSGMALRALAWCLLSLGKTEQAQSYYKKILDRKPAAMDYLNAGHTEWILGNIPQAITFYRQSLQLRQQSVADLQFFAEDAQLLASHGILSDDLSMMVDIINERTLQS